MTRTSLELHSDFCRLVVVDVSANAEALSSRDVRVRAFVSHLSQHPESAGFIDALRRARREYRLPREAVVTMWGLRAIHQHVRLESVDDAALESQAVAAVREEVALLEADGTRASIAISAGDAWADAAGQWREVSLTAASGIEVAYRIEPLTSAGFDVVRVITPAMALASVARSRVDVRQGIAAMYVALAPHATAIAIVRDGLLLVARELPFGHASGDAAGELPFGTRLTSELRRSQLFFRQTWRCTLDTVVMCGDVEHMRTLAASIGTALSVPVETLDALTGIDAAAVPEPAGEFRDAVAALRLAVSAGAEPAPFASLLPIDAESNAPAAGHVLRWFGVAAAAVIVASVLWFAFLRPATARAPSRDSASQAQTRDAVRPDGPAVINPATAGPPVNVAAAAEDTPTPPPAAKSPQPSSAPGRDIVVGSILYSPNRRLAIVNGRIAGIGDDVGGLRLVAIERRAVVVESADGVQHRIALGPAARVQRE